MIPDMAEVRDTGDGEGRKQRQPAPSARRPLSANKAKRRVLLGHPLENDGGP